MGEFLAMGGYAAFVWPAFGVTTVVLIANVVAARRQDRQVRKRLMQRLARQPRRTTVP